MLTGQKEGFTGQVLDLLDRGRDLLDRAKTHREGQGFNRQPMRCFITRCTKDPSYTSYLGSIHLNECGILSLRHWLDLLDIKKRH